MSQLQVFIANILLLFLPNIFVWTGIFIIGLIAFMIINKTPFSVAGHLTFILVWVLARNLQGEWSVFHMLMLALLGIFTVLGFFKIGNREK